MPIGMGQIIGIGLKLVANRDKIAAAWGTVAPILKQLQDSGVIADLLPKVVAPQPPMLSVQWLQESLNKLNNAGLAVDGTYGEATRAAVTMYQQAHSLEPDGWAGVATQASIYEELAKRR
jgi:peptidoglycan hydrolase-like protein with peptidoglycan-binding domain